MKAINNVSDAAMKLLRENRNFLGLTARKWEAAKGAIRAATTFNHPDLRRHVTTEHPLLDSA
ncbi:MAG: hypothetical protein ACTHOJ_15545 [Sphingomonas oligoaromativorans]